MTAAKSFLRHHRLAWSTLALYGAVKRPKELRSFFTQQAPDGESLKATISSPSDPEKKREFTGKIVRGWAIVLSTGEILGGEALFEDTIADLVVAETRVQGDGR
jgi:hypothetical protein